MGAVRAEESERGRERERRWSNGSVPHVDFIEVCRADAESRWHSCSISGDICAASVSGCLDGNNNGRESALAS